MDEKNIIKLEIKQQEIKTDSKKEKPFANKYSTNPLIKGLLSFSVNDIKSKFKFKDLFR